MRRITRLGMAIAAALHRAMRAVSCLGGETQIERVLAHAIAENQKQKLGALVFVGDAMEENVDRLCRLAGELGWRGDPQAGHHVHWRGRLDRQLLGQVHAVRDFKRVVGLEQRFSS